MPLLTFVTGGTGSVGQALVMALTAAGYEVHFQYCHSNARADLLSGQTGATAIQLDFSQLPCDLPIFDYQLLINNVGVNVSRRISHQVSQGEWDYTLNVNLRSAFLLTKAYLPKMVEMQYGRIINISSIYGFRSVESNLPYSVSKHGLSALTKTVAREYGQFGITCNEICPGPIQSEMMERIATAQTNGTDMTPDMYLRGVAATIPNRRLAHPNEVASLALYLASDDAKYINGASLVLDGGMTI